VYAAGFLRTAAAANRLAAMERKRPAAPGASLNPAVATAPAKLRSSLPPAATHVQAPPPAAPAVAPVPPASTSAPVATSTALPVAVAAVPTTPAPVPAAPAPVAVPDPAVVLPPAPVAPAVAATPAAPTFKDGIFYGWGHCRHGDLQASVEIKGGKIVASAIAQCFTRYSQDVIAALPPEVVQRQSNNVDWVSGATESSDAFFYAVGEALKQAK